RRVHGRNPLEGLRDLLADADRRLRDVQGAPGRRADRARVALQHEPRHLRDAGPRGGVDAVDRAHGRGGRPLRLRLRRARARADGLTVRPGLEPAWWLQEAPPDEELPPLEGDLECEVAIAGGGYSGLWTAIALLERQP